MNMKLRILVLLAALVLVLGGAFALVGCAADEPAPVPPAPAEPTAPAEPPAGADAGEAILVGSCTDCHSAEQIYLQPEGTDWREVVTRMETAHGATITAAERDSLIAFLESRQQSDVEKTISGECSTCHDLTTIYSQPAGSNWEGVMSKMIEVHGLVLSVPEQEAVIEYLSNR